MAKKKFERRLAVIFAADMVCYSRLMEAEEEEGTIARSPEAVSVAILQPRSLRQHRQF